MKPNIPFALFAALLHCLEDWGLSAFVFYNYMQGNKKEQ